jgi:rRNA-processing protein FCF1
MGFGFREPYQVLVDADFLAEANKCKMDVIRRLEDTLHAREVKPSTLPTSLLCCLSQSTTLPMH